MTQHRDYSLLTCQEGGTTAGPRVSGFSHGLKLRRWWVSRYHLPHKSDSYPIKKIWNKWKYEIKRTEVCRDEYTAKKTPKERSPYFVHV